MAPTEQVSSKRESPAEQNRRNALQILALLARDNGETPKFEITGDPILSIRSLIQSAVETQVLTDEAGRKLMEEYCDDMRGEDKLEVLRCRLNADSYSLVRAFAFHAITTPDPHEGREFVAEALRWLRRVMKYED